MAVTRIPIPDWARTLETIYAALQKIELSRRIQQGDHALLSG